MSPWSCCSRLRLAEPIGRSPFAALPFRFLERRSTKPLFWSAVSVSPWWRVASAKTLRIHTAIPFTSTRTHSCSWQSASIARVGELREYCMPITTSPHVSHFHGSTGASTVVPGPSRGTIPNTTSTCSLSTTCHAPGNAVLRSRGGHLGGGAGLHEATSACLPCDVPFVLSLGP